MPGLPVANRLPASKADGTSGHTCGQHIQFINDPHVGLQKKHKTGHTILAECIIFSPQRCEMSGILGF